MKAKRHILEEHYLDFYSRAMSILDDEEDAKDAVQEAVVKTLVSVGVRDKVAFCYRVTENECFSILRRRRRLVQLDEEVMSGDRERARLHEELQEARSLLLPLEQRALELHHDFGYTLAETASQVNVSASTVKRLLASAEKKIKKAIKR